MVNTESTKAITMTPSAVEHIEHYLKKHDAKAMRLTVKKSGCSGLKYDIVAVNEIHADDKVFTENNAVVVISSSDLLYYAGTELDYIQEGLNKKLIFNNPLAQNVCGCGESFNLKQE
ncbi:MAG: iron-sulfur cluster assembly accessory protein [Gammaproteobacteria bacterium]|nr:iron-sulfur cluster assembly accessory protein [Gammaproteobacteria bacterium]